VSGSSARRLFNFAIGFSIGSTLIVLIALPMFTPSSFRP